LSDAAKILLLDIETAPNLSYVWGMWEQNVIEVEQHWYVLSFSYKWFGQKKINTCALPDFVTYHKSKEDDSSLIKALHCLLNEADVVICHNGDRFDIRKSNARFIVHALPPPSPYKTIDTLKIAKKHFAFDSNKLDSLGAYLGVGRKIAHTGYRNLWLQCMAGDPVAWAKMRRYNERDVQLLERVYMRLRPWASTPSQHPNLTLWTRDAGCPICQCKKIESKGWRYAPTGRRRRFLCHGCGHRFDAGPLIRDS
jgi:RNase_H superfamily